ncbi:MAG: DUF1801 domain-containing protein [Burkholderiales bacterium]
MAELKTRKTGASVLKFLESVENERRRKDSLELLEIFIRITKMSPVVWGNGIVGFGEYHYKSERSSQEGNWPLTGFSPRKGNMTVYVMPGFSDYQELLSKLGKHKTSVSCIYFNSLESIDLTILKQIIRRSVGDMKKRYQWK